MTEMLPFVVLGLASGSVYGMAATGLVLTFKTSGIFNFAHGSIAAAAAYVFYELHYELGLGWPVALGLCVLGAGPLAGLLLERVARRLSPAPTTVRIVATVGLLLAIQGLALARYGPEARYFPSFLPTASVSVAGARMGVDQLLVLVMASAVSLGLAAFFRRSRTGRAMRAVVDDSQLLALTGTDPVRVRRGSWMVGAGFAALSGILIAPTAGLDVYVLTMLVVQAFGAAAIGRFSNLGMTFVGGLVVGVAAAIATKAFGGVPELSGVPSSIPFLVLFAVLLFSRGKVESGTPVRRSARRPAPVAGGRGATRLAPGGVVVAVAVAFLPMMAGPRLPVFTQAAVFVVLFLSMAVLVNLSGQVSLCHAAFAALGAASFARLVEAGVPWVPALLLGGLATVPLGAIVAIPAIRLSPLHLALATLGFGILVERMLFPTALMFGQLGTLTVARPGLLGLADDRRFFYLMALLAAGAVWAAGTLCRSRLGRLLRGIADAPVTLATMGTDVNVTRVLVFCISAFMAGIAGALLGAAQGSVSGIGFGPMHSMVWLAVLTIGGSGVIRPAILAAIGLSVLPVYLSSVFGEYQSVVFGGLAVLAALGHGAQMPGLMLHALADASARRMQRSPVHARNQALARGGAG